MTIWMSAEADDSHVLSNVILPAIGSMFVTIVVGLFAMGKCRRRREAPAETDVRKEYLELHLKTHKVVAVTSEDVCGNIQKNNSSTGEELDPEAAATTPSTNISNIHKGDLILSLPPPTMTDSQKEESDLNEKEEDDDRPMCAICVVAYEGGDVISWSKNDQCHHCFHKECIQEWLLLHEDCPCCRLPFLVVVPEHKGEGNDNAIRILGKAEEEEEGGC